MFNDIGFELIYPDGCTSLSGDLKIEELRKGLNELNSALRDLMKQTGLMDESIEAVNTNELSTSQCDARDPIKLTGLLMHLLTPQFTTYPDVDIRLRVCVAVCSLLKLFCPTNPFENTSNCQSIVKTLLRFLHECISNLSKLQSKHDANYPRLYMITYTCCKLDIFTWCRLLDDGADVLLESLKLLFGALRNLPIWSWSDEMTIQQFFLDTIVILIQQSASLLSDHVLIYLLSFLIEPDKSTQPIQHALVKDLIIRTANHLEYPIQLLLQNALVTNDEVPTPTVSNAYISSKITNEQLGEHIFILIYALHTLKSSLVAPILPCIEMKLKSTISRQRKRAFRLLTRIFAEPNSTVHQKNPELWTSYLSRFHDIDVDVRSFCVQMIPLMIRQNSELPKDELFNCLKSSIIDRSDSVRLLALKTTASLMRELKEGFVVDLFEMILCRSRDKCLAVRKEVLTELAQVYKRCLQVDRPNNLQMSSALNATLHMYYQPLNEDKIAVERLFKSCIVPYNFDTKKRVKSLFLCYQFADDAAIKSVQELFKVQFAAAKLVREALVIIVENQGKKIVGDANVDMMKRLHNISGLLPKSEKSLDSLKRFFNAIHSDRSLRINVCQLYHPKCSSRQATQCMRDILKRVSQSGGEANYEHTVKMVLERSASVLFDEDFGQELVTQLVISKDTIDDSQTKQNDSTSLGAQLEIVKGLRILLALSVYYKDMLPVDDILIYINSVLTMHVNAVPISSPSVPMISGNSLTNVDEDPQTVVELSLQILCCLLGGGPLNGVRDTVDSQMEHFNAELELLVTEGKKGKKTVTTGSDKIKKTPNPSSKQLFTGTRMQLFEQVTELLPLLQTFCTTGITTDYAPVPCTTLPTKEGKTGSPVIMDVDQSKGGRQKKSKKQEEKAVNAVVVPTNHSEVDEGLAWRRERRRVKLSIRLLRQLLSAVHLLAGSKTRFPNGPVSGLDAISSTITTAEEESEYVEEKVIEANDNDNMDEIGGEEGDDEDETASNFEEAPKMADMELSIQTCLDEIVQKCLDCTLEDTNYIASLTTLSHVALLFPGLYNRQLKTLINQQLFAKLLTRDTMVVAEPGKSKKSKKRQEAMEVKTRSGKPSDWTKDGHVSILTRAKMAAIKLMANWLVGLTLQNKAVAQVIIRLLHCIIVNEGDLNRAGIISYGDMSRLRLIAATNWLKIAHLQSYVEVIEVVWYQTMSYVLCDPCPEVRSQFLVALHQGLLRLKLPLEYIAMFVHVADIPDANFRQRARQFLVANIKRRREFLGKHTSFQNNPKLLFALLPDFILVYAIHLLAHDPDWTTVNDTARLTIVKSALSFIMDPIMAGGNNYTFLRQLLEKIKHSRDALCENDETANLKIYISCDIALGLLLTRCTNIVWKSCQFDIKLPHSLFIRAPSSFSNPDFAQLCGGPNGDTPRITFTPVKNARAVKEGLIHAKFIKTKLAPANSMKSIDSYSTVKENEHVEEEDDQDLSTNVDLDQESSHSQPPISRSSITSPIVSNNETTLETATANLALQSSPDVVIKPKKRIRRASCNDTPLKAEKASDLVKRPRKTLPNPPTPKAAGSITNNAKAKLPAEAKQAVLLPFLRQRAGNVRNAGPTTGSGIKKLLPPVETKKSTKASQLGRPAPARKELAR